MKAGAEDAWHNSPFSQAANLPDKGDGIQIVNLVEGVAAGISNDQIKPSDTVMLSGLVAGLVDAISPMVHEPVLTFAAAVFAWNGCMSMAKLIQRESSGNILRRWVRSVWKRKKNLWEYDDLQKRWTKQEIERENVWVKYGVTLARALKKLEYSNDKDFEKNVDDSWVPQGSPYWS
jgi:hypothetical protein